MKSDKLYTNKRFFFCWPNKNGLPSWIVISTFCATVLLLTLSILTTDINLLMLLNSGWKLLHYSKYFITMPDWDYFPTMLARFWETIQITLTGSFFAVLISLPLATLAARKATPHILCSHFFRICFSVIRALPEMLWALLFVSAFGLGPIPGVLAMAVVSVGFMGLFFTEALDSVQTRTIEGVRASGAGWTQLRLYGMLPPAMPSIVGTILYLLDHNLRAATLLGLVGAGGIGYDMIIALRLFQFDRLIMIIATIFVLIFLLDRLSAYTRRIYI